MVVCYVVSHRPEWKTKSKFSWKWKWDCSLFTLTLYISVDSMQSHLFFVFFHLHSHIIFPLHKYAAHTTAAILLRELMCSGWWWWLENVMRSTFPFISSAKLLGIFILFSTYILPQSFESPRCISHKEFIFFGLFLFFIFVLCEVDQQKPVLVLREKVGIFSLSIGVYIEHA